MPGKAAKMLVLTEKFRIPELGGEMALLRYWPSFECVRYGPDPEKR